MAKEITVKDAPARLYHKYPNRATPQPVYVQLDCAERVLSIAWNDGIGGAVPAAVWHGHVLRWTVPALHQDTAQEFLSSLKGLAQRVVDGYEKHWNGMDHIGRYDEDAMHAREQIERMCETRCEDPTGTFVVWSAEDWFAGLGDKAAQCRELGITAETSDEELEAIAEKEREHEGPGCDVDVIEGLEIYLERLSQYADEHGIDGCNVSKGSAGFGG